MKGKHFISTINQKLLDVKKRYRLFKIFNKNYYSLNGLYGVFLEDCTFQFAFESSLSFEAWEEVKNGSKIPYYELVHKRQFQLFSLDTSRFLTDSYVDDIPWHNGELMTVDGKDSFAVEAKQLLPYCMGNIISLESLERANSVITKLLSEDPTSLEDYFKPKTFTNK